jgi:hypothetical protein
MNVSAFELVSSPPPPMIVALGPIGPDGPEGPD